MWHLRIHSQMLMAAGLLAPVGTAAAQHAPAAPTTTLPVLGTADYARWETLGNGALSPDGKWVAYDLRRGDGSTELRYRPVGSADEHTARSGSNPQFSHDSRWLIYSVAADTARRGNRGARGAGAGAAAPANHNKVAIVDLATGRTTTLDDIQSFELSDDGSHVALRGYGTPGRRGADVIVRDLAHGTDVSFGNVAELSWSDDGRLLAMAIDVDGHTGDGVQLLDVSTGALVPLDASDDEYGSLAWRAHAHDLVALRSRPDSAFADTSYTAIAWRGLGAHQSRQVYDFSTDESFPKTMRVTAYRTPEWSEDGRTVYLGVAPREPRIVPVRLAPGELPPARVQVWHWKDLREFHQQEVQGAQDRARTTLAAWHVGPNTLVRLGDDPNDIVQLSEDRSTVLTSDENPYVREIMSGRSYRDVYRVDPATGQRTKLLTKSAYGATLSPSGKHALYQQDGHWYALDLASGARTDLTGRIKSPFVDMEDDHPVAERRAYGVGGFTAGDKSAILYDRFDAWLVNLDGSSATRLTRGREDSTVLRCVTAGFGRGRGGGRGGRGGAATAPSAPCQPGSDVPAIDPSKPLLFTATGEYDKKSGYARVTIGQAPQRLVWLDKQVTRLAKADEADVYLMEEQTAEESPNFFVAGANVSDAKPVSNTNAFQHEFAWGKQVLMPYTNKRGDKLQMMLTYPADYQPGRKYPMVVYYYEKLSQGFHQYVVPNLRNPYNVSVFSQNGYFVLRPDIVFQARNPGYSGLDCVTSAVAEVEKRVSDIDAAHVGNMGHSWGGYQSAFYAVHNHGTFAASIAGAPLTDLISMYGYTSGNSGLPETGHYETSQERMQVPLWSDPQAYIRNSTVYSVDSLHTPLLLEEGDADGNVNHFQSEELYNFGRRLGKNVVYLVYEGENHNVARPESQADYLERQLQWFGHYLKGEPAASWIENGETYLERQRILEAAKAVEGGGAQALQAGRARRP